MSSFHISVCQNNNPTMTKNISLFLLGLYTVATGKEKKNTYILEKLALFLHQYYITINWHDQIFEKGIPKGTGVEATHLFAPPLYFLSYDPLNPNGVTVNDESTEELLKIFVSPDDSSIRIKKDSDYTVTYNLEWKNET